MDEQRLRRLLDVGRSPATVLDHAVLERRLDVARELIGARHAAISRRDERRERLQRFLTAGVDAETSRDIDDASRGRGALGALIRGPHQPRLDDAGSHAQPSDSPPGAPAR